MNARVFDENLESIYFSTNVVNIPRSKPRQIRDERARKTFLKCIFSKT